MTITEAMKKSQETSKAIQRDAIDGFCGWLTFMEDWTYKLEAVDLMADDWCLVGDDNPST